MTTVAEAPKTAAIRIPALGRLWSGRKAQLRPPQQPTTRRMAPRPDPSGMSTRIMRPPGPDDVPTRRMAAPPLPRELSTRIMRPPGPDDVPTRRMEAIADPRELSTRIMRQPGPDDIPTQRMEAPTPPQDLSTRIMRQPGGADDVPTRRLTRPTPAEEETRVMSNPELFGDDFIARPSLEELDQVNLGLPRGMFRRKTAISLRGILPKVREVGGRGLDLGRQGLDLGRKGLDLGSQGFGRVSGANLRTRGRNLLNRGATGSAGQTAAKALRAGRQRGLAAGAGAGTLGAAGMMAAGGGESPETITPADAAQQRLQQRMDSPLGGLLDDIINPETKEMAAARSAERERLGDDIGLMQRWQLMDPNIRTLLVSLLLGGGLAAGTSLLR